MVALPRGLPRTSCCCYAKASAESVRFWRLPRVLAEAMGMDGQPRGTHLGASGLRAPQPSWTGSRPSIPAPCSTVAGGGWRGASSSVPPHYPGVATSGRLGLPPKATRPGVRPRRGRTTPLPEGHGCGCRQSHLAQLARREVELGLPGLLRRPLRRSHTSGTGPTPRLDLSPRLHEPYPELRSSTSRLVASYTASARSRSTARSRCASVLRFRPTDSGATTRRPPAA